MLCEALGCHQVSILAQLGFELLCARLCEHVEQGEDFGMLLCQLLDGGQVFELREVDDIHGLDRQDDAPPSVILSLRNCAVILVVEFQVSENNLEGRS